MILMFCEGIVLFYACENGFLLLASSEVLCDLCRSVISFDLRDTFPRVVRAFFAKLPILLHEVFSLLCELLYPARISFLFTMK